VTIARWESGATEPKFETAQEVVAACELYPTLGLAMADEGSLTALIHEQLGREPAERVKQLSRDRFDRVAALIDPAPYSQRFALALDATLQLHVRVQAHHPKP
jgi:hypothetical protein